MDTDPGPRLGRSTAISCLSEGARAAITSAITPQPMKTTATNTTRTAYSAGVGFRLGGKKRNITICFSLQLTIPCPGWEAGARGAQWKAGRNVKTLILSVLCGIPGPYS